MPSYTLEHEILPAGFNFHLERRRGRFTGSRRQVPFDEWQDEMHSGAPLLRLLAANGAATLALGKLLVAHHIIASLAPAEARALELPSSCPYSLRLEAQGAFSDLPGAGVHSLASRERWHGRQTSTRSRALEAAG